jgi:hypothetical protein
MDPKLNKKFPECANEALILIRSNYNRIGKQELMHLAYEFIFFYDFNKEQKMWIKVRASHFFQWWPFIDDFNFFREESKSNARASMCRLYNEFLGNRKRTAS